MFSIKIFFFLKYNLFVLPFECRIFLFLCILYNQLLFVHSIVFEIDYKKLESQYIYYTNKFIYICIIFYLTNLKFFDKIIIESGESGNISAGNHLIYNKISNLHKILYNYLCNIFKDKILMCNIFKDKILTCSFICSTI